MLRNARFRLFRGEKTIGLGIYLSVDFWLEAPRFYFIRQSGIIGSDDDG